MPCPGAGHCWVGNKPHESSQSGPVILPRWLSGERQTNKKLNALLNDHRDSLKNNSSPVYDINSLKSQSLLTNTFKILCIPDEKASFLLPV